MDVVCEQLFMTEMDFVKIKITDKNDSLHKKTRIRDCFKHTHRSSKINNMSFNMNSTIMNDKNMVLLCEGPYRRGDKCDCDVGPDKNCNLKAVCYSPKNASGTVSLIKANNDEKKTVTTDQDLVVIPANAIIDCVEFFGNNFSCKGSINIGLGQLNSTIMMPLIDNADSTIANEKAGGCRQFIYSAQNGKNSRNIVLFDSNINLALEHPVTSGVLQVIITYHMRPSLKSII